MFDSKPESIYPDEGSDFFADEFGERIETPESAGLIPEEDISKTDLDMEELLEEDELTEDEVMSFRESLAPEEATDNPKMTSDNDDPTTGEV